MNRIRCFKTTVGVMDISITGEQILSDTLDLVSINIAAARTAAIRPDTTTAVSLTRQQFSSVDIKRKTVKSCATWNKVREPVNKLFVISRRALRVPLAYPDRTSLG